MDTLSEIKESIKKIASTGGMFRAFTAKVKSVNGKTCTVELEGLTLTDVRLRAVVNGENSKILVTPKTDSYVLVVDLAGNLSQLAVVGYSEVEKIEVDADNIVFNGGDNKGLVKIEELKSNLNSLKNYVEAMASAVLSAFNAVGAGPTASGSAGAGSFEGSMSGRSISFEDMEDDKITH